MEVLVYIVYLNLASAAVILPAIGIVLLHDNGNSKHPGDGDDAGSTRYA